MKSIILILILSLIVVSCNHSSKNKKDCDFVSKNLGYINRGDTGCLNESGLPNIYIAKVNGKCGLINEKLEIICPIIYNKIDTFVNGFARVCKNPIGDLYKWGFINKCGEEVIPCIYDAVYNFNKDGVAIILQSFNARNGYSRQFLINTKGEVISDTMFYIDEEFSDGIIGATDLHWKRVYLNTNGKTILVSPYFYADAFSEGLACVRDSTFAQGGFKAGFMDIHGKMVIPYGYWGGPLPFNDGLSVVRHKDSIKYGYINKKGKLAIGYRFDDANSFHNGLAVVSFKKKCGYIDTKGHFIIQPQFDYAAPFQCGFAIVGKIKDNFGMMPSYNFGYINSKGTLITGYDFETASDFKDGFAIVIKKDKKYLINTSGKIVKRLKYCPGTN